MFKLFISFLVLFSTACVDNISKHGLKLTEEKLERIHLGSTSQMVVKELIGPPTINTTRGDKEIWYYIDYERNKRPFKLPYYVSYDVVEVEFVDDRVVKLNKYDKAAMNKIAFNKNETQGREGKRSIFRQLLGNVGRFDGSSDL